MLQVLLFVCCCSSLSFAHNIDINVGPIIKKHASGSYFGFSATGVSKERNTVRWLAVGSPRANDTAFDDGKKTYRNTGAFYRCPISMDMEDCTNITSSSGSINIDISDPTNGWYGISVAGGGEKDQTLMVCSHRVSVLHCRACWRPTLPGYCIIYNKDGGVDGDELDAIYKSNEQDNAGVPALQIAVSYKRSRFGQTGIGATVGYKDRSLYAGAVGDWNWRGSIVTVEGKNERTSNQVFSYGGYSMASGAFFMSDSNDFAIGAPRYDMNGAVLLKSSLDIEDPKLIIKGEKYGSYFGMAIAAGDFDGDKLYEIVVGAPYFSESIPSTGKVYVYSGKNNFKSPIRMYTSTNPEAHALFGRAVAAVGDLDQSGYDDLVIGAPYEGNGGVIYIYHGSNSGLSENYVQRIVATALMNKPQTFGWSIRGETDLDANGYPDLVVGAYLNDTVMILRSVPVVEVDVKFKLSSPSIDVSNKTCTIEDDKGKKFQTVCFNVTVDASYMDRAKMMSNEIELTFQIDADTLVRDVKKRRVIFQASNSPNLIVKNARVKTGEFNDVVNALAYMKIEKGYEYGINPYPDIQLKVTPSLPDRAKPSPPPTTGTPPSLKPYFKLPYTVGSDPLSNTANISETMIYVKRACDPCKPNLSIKNVGTTKIPVGKSSIFLDIEISNTGDTAFSTVFVVNLPVPLIVRPCPPDVKKECLYTNCQVERNNTRLVCELGNLKKSSKDYAIKVDTVKASKSRSTYIVTMNVSSLNEEDKSLLGDNYLSLELNVTSTADIELLASTSGGKLYGGVVRGQFAMDSVKEIGVEVDHTYKVLNKGPDFVPEVNITIHWPYQAANGKHLLYLVDIMGKGIKSKNAKCFPDEGVVNSLASQFTEDGNRRRRRAVEEKQPSSAKSQVRGGSASMVTLDCRNGTAMCVSIPCTFYNINRDESVEVVLKARLWNGTLLEDYSGRDVHVISYGRITDWTSYVVEKDDSNHEAEAFSRFFPDSIKTKKRKIAVWIYVVSAVAGLVLLIILIVVFKMCGFFNRQQQYTSVPES